MDIKLINKLKVLISEYKGIRLELLMMIGVSFIIGLICMMFVGNITNRVANAYASSFFTLSAFVIAFIFSFHLLTQRKIKYIITIAEGLTYISKGNLHYRFQILRKDELGKVAMSINAMTEQLERQLQKEREIEKSKMELITGVSHDLRTPLTSIIGYLDLLRNKSFQDQKEYERFIDNTYKKSMQLKKQIDDLFEYTRLTSHDVQLNLQKVDVRNLLEQILFEMEPLFAENELSICKDIEAKPLYTCIDSEKFVRVIENMLMNALKYSIKPGNIKVSLTTDERFFSISFSNKGIPITKEQVDYLFERFYKVDESRSNQSTETGTGLGLSIAKSIVEQHNGKIELVHDSGDFSFIVTIPLLHQN